jgi:hypothetical protein
MATKANDNKGKPLNDIEKQVQPLPNEFDLKDVKTKVFLAAQKASARFSNDKLKR